MIRPGLGTVQIGLPYGNKASEGVMPEEDAFSILKTAAENGITFFDTAQAYGCSEERIGKFLKSYKAASQVEVSTKIPAVAVDLWSQPREYERFVLDTVEKSRALLNLKSLNLLQFHQCDTAFLSDSNVINLFKQLLERGICRKIGVSVYEPKQVDCLLLTPEVSTIQIPANLIDQRFLTPEFLRKYKELNKTIIVRSIFLQGVLHPHSLLPNVGKKALLDKLRKKSSDVVAKWNLSLDEVALKWIFGNHSHNVDVGLIGAQSAQELTQNLKWIKPTGGLSQEVLSELVEVQNFALENELNNPAKW